MEDVSGFPLATTLGSLAQLPQEFRDNATELLRLGGSEREAHVWKLAAQVAEQRLRDSFLEPLTLDAAVSESGYTRGHLLRMLREKKVPNAGTKENPRILRKHIPRKPGLEVDAGTIRPASSQRQAARAVVQGEN